MSGWNLVKKTIFKNGSLMRQIRPLHTTPALNFKGVAKRESLNSDFILDLHYEFHYRDQIPFTKEDEKKNLIADISMGVVMAFVIYKCYSETEHLV
ncbi:uncharacterized protein LOC112693644 isoform X2 [Sipha flava]|nr:uncharacterized protein LOC112693644 isoform X2 [Sipha flava]